MKSAVGMVPRGGDDIHPSVNAFQSLVAKRDGGRWQIYLVQNTPAAFHGRPEEAARLSAELRSQLPSAPTQRD